MKIDCIADLHGHYPKLEGGDLLIVAGDLTKSDAQYQYLEFREWMQKQKYKKKVFICGNHDGQIENGGFYFSNDWMSAEYLCDSGTEFEGLKIWGSPRTKRFTGMNPNCMAFTVETEEELAQKWALIPDDVDILVTHGPPASMLDWNKHGENCGSRSLLMRATNLPNLKLLVFGHVHECYGQYHREEFVEFANDYEKIFGPPKCKSMPHIVNASHVNERYEPVNKPIRVDL